LDAVRETAIERESQLAVQRVRARTARALHDRALQTLETVAKGTTVTDPRLRAEVEDQAAWLRAFVETGNVDHEHDLTVGLETVARMARRAGLRVEVNYAAFLRRDQVPIGDEQRVAVVEATREVLDAMSGVAREVVIQARPDGTDRVVVTVLATSTRAVPGTLDVDQARSTIGRVGGHLLVESPPYVELRVPVAGESSIA
jgi:hypothetical protein